MPPQQRSTKEVVDDTRVHLRELVDAHVELAKAEMKEAQAQLVRGLVPMVVAGVLGLYALGFFAVTAVKGLDNYLTEGFAWLVVSVAVAVLLGLLALLGISRLKKVEPAPRRTQENVRETIEWAKSKTGGSN